MRQLPCINNILTWVPTIPTLLIRQPCHEDSVKVRGRICYRERFYDLTSQASCVSIERPVALNGMNVRRNDMGKSK